MSSGKRVDRRTVIKSTGAAGIFGLAGCLGDDGNGNGTTGGSDDTPEVRFILNPAESDVDIEAQYQPMFEYLESEVDVSIEPVPTSSYAATLQEIRRGGGEVADTSPSAAVAGKDVADVIGIRVAFGAAQYFSLITTTPDENGVDSLPELEGEEIAMASTLSVSGTLAPMVMLKDAGLDVGSAPDGEPNDFTARYSDHSTARDQLIENPSIAAATTGAFSTAPHVPQEQFDEMSQDFVEISAEYENAGSAIEEGEAELKLLAVSDPLPRAPLMSRADWDDPVREEVEQAILDADEEDLAHDEDYEGEELWFTGVKEGSHEDFQPIADIMEELGLEFGDLS